MRTFKIGDVIYHESRYWKTDNLGAGEVPGWNARYLPYVVTRVTDSRIYATGCGPSGLPSSLFFPRRPKHHPRAEQPTTLEGDGKQYHSRFHEYFYAEIPKPKPQRRAAPHIIRALAVLGVGLPYSDDDVHRAYKRLARQRHPDAGGSHQAFIELKEARDVALRRY